MWKDDVRFEVLRSMLLKIYVISCCATGYTVSDVSKLQHSFIHCLLRGKKIELRCTVTAVTAM